MSIYYNEFNPNAAAWLRELMADNVIAPGVVDERSITDIDPDELKDFAQCHFFAGIGTWSYALRRAGWSDTRPVWTGSCPCQPFSEAGLHKGVDDERHLWPIFLDLIKANRPDIVLGEQVASADVIGKVRGPHAGKDSKAWIDIVLADLEDAHYTSGAVVASSASFGAPNIRQRTWWMGYTQRSRLERFSRHGTTNNEPGRFCTQSNRFAASSGVSGRVANCNCNRCDQSQSLSKKRCDGIVGNGSYSNFDSTNGYWSDPDWIFCRDNKWRPVESGTSPLVAGTSRSMVSSRDSSTPINPQDSDEALKMRIEGYGNAINAEVATAFVECAMMIIDD